MKSLSKSRASGGWSRRSSQRLPQESTHRRSVRMAEDTVLVKAAGREIAVTSPSKVFFPERSETKLDLVRYYQSVEEPLMRAMAGRPVLLQRFPNGAGGPSFFQKRVPDLRPEWLQTAVVSTPNGTTSDALVAADLAHVIWAVNLGCIGFHVWPSSGRPGACRRVAYRPGPL